MAEGENRKRAPLEPSGPVLQRPCRSAGLSAEAEEPSPHTTLSLELPDVRASTLSDPRGFLATHPPPVIFDEIQYCPDILMYVKEAIDAHRSRRGQYLLTGSQNMLLLERVTESLAG